MNPSQQYGIRNTRFRENIDNMNKGSEIRTTLEQAFKQMSPNQFIGVAIQTKPGCGALWFTREILGRANPVLNCFQTDDEFLHELDEVVTIMQPEHTLILDIHDATFKVNYAMWPSLMRIVQNGGSFVFISKHKIVFDGVPTPLTNRMIHMNL